VAAVSAVALRSAREQALHRTHKALLDDALARASDDLTRVARQLIPPPLCESSSAPPSPPNLFLDTWRFEDLTSIVQSRLVRAVSNLDPPSVVAAARGWAVAAAAAAARERRGRPVAARWVVTVARLGVSAAVAAVAVGGGAPRGVAAQVVEGLGCEEGLRLFVAAFRDDAFVVDFVGGGKVLNSYVCF
jgi:hypothetical protein